MLESTPGRNVAKLRAESIRLRFLGGYLTLSRGQWADLADLLDRTTELDARDAEWEADRIRGLIVPDAYGQDDRSS